jgi:L-fuconolactonase
MTVIDSHLEIFGPYRLMLGSDWPVAILAGGYRRVWGELVRIVDELRPAECDAILGGTAAAFYGLISTGLGGSDRKAAG